jgi:hypothetical protein
MAMTQLLLNIEDESKTNMLLDFLKSLNYINVQMLSEENIIVSEQEKDIMRARKQNARPGDFKDWDEIKNSFDSGQ